MADETQTPQAPEIVSRRNGEAFIRRVIDGPVLVADTQVETFAANLRELANHNDFPQLSAAAIGPEDDDEFWNSDDYMATRYRPYKVKNGVLTIPVMGSLVNRMSYQMGRYATGYEYIHRAVERGMADPNVKTILFHVDSPGGQAAGNFELVEFIASKRGEKPMLAMVQDYALSGGFSIATAADEVVVSSSGATGSVGVVVMHVDFSEMLSEFGIKVTFIKAGKHKTDGNSYEPLSEDAKARIQAGVDKFYGMFVSTVAQNRNMEDDAVRETEALVYDADESVETGFADRIGDFRSEMAALARRETGEKTMSKDNDTTKDTQIDATQIASDARAEERKRFAEVQGSEHYAGREALAQKFLGETDMSAEQIIGFLEDAPKAESNEPDEVDAEDKGQKRNHFAEAMDKEGSPQVGGIDGEEDGNDDAGLSADGRPKASVSILAAYKASGGRTRDAKAS